MQKTFFYFFDKSENCYTQIWSEGIFVFDANILLNLYRYSEQTRIDFFSIMDELKERLWLPHQAAYEYSKNRREVIIEQGKHYADFRTTVSNKFNDLKVFLENKERDLKKNTHFESSEFISILEEYERQLHQKIDQIRDEKRGIFSLSVEDPVLLKLEQIYETTIGVAFSEQEKEEHLKEAEKRLKDKIPPGFKDEKKDTNKHGDFLIWVQIQIYAKQIQKPIIFVTDDEKSDWWLRTKGQTLGLHPELIEEFKNKTGQEILIYNSANFIKFAQRVFSAEVRVESIREVESVNLSQKEISIQEGLATILPEESTFSTTSAVIERCYRCGHPNSFLGNRCSNCGASQDF